MSDYIKREDALELALKPYTVSMIERIWSIPAAEVVPVVHCRDCINRPDKEFDLDPFSERHICPFRGRAIPSDDFFCGNGEKMDLEVETE